MNVENNQPLLTPFLSQLQQMYGSVDPNRVQTRRRKYYSYVKYPELGQSVFNFFATPVGSSNRQLTNIQRSGHLDNPMIVRAINCRYFIGVENFTSFDGTHLTSLYADLNYGFFQSGILKVVIGSKEWLTLPAPFLYAPPACGRPKVNTAGNTLTLTEGTPNVRATQIGPIPAAHLPSGKPQAYIIDPSFMIGNDQNFQITIEYPSGVLPVLATTLIDDTTNPLYIGVELDGIEIRPVQ